MPLSTPWPNGRRWTRSICTCWEKARAAVWRELPHPGMRPQLKAMILYYPAFCIPEDAQKKFARVEDIPETGKVLNQNVGRIYNEKLLDYDIYEEIRHFSKPVLILHGDGDTVVDISYGQRAAEVYPNATFKRYPGETHGFMGKGKLRAAKDSYQFLEENR